jgi:hypothetical protein
MRYILLVSSCAAKLEADVNYWINDMGYKPQGGAFYNGSTEEYAQAMIKE